ncbi:Hypothetical predicted protein [Olea europaea subsp. europaea]|uniref:Uncharacterized protein n=1 Tax=Olea europaea subsp. europaea TaxID=158383 RepID=A0A8S0S8Z3_OLEEU|nr:Hypothetical predicted protein [Olea europaea subsp. europaea]
MESNAVEQILPPNGSTLLQSEEEDFASLVANVLCDSSWSWIQTKKLHSE